MAERCVAATASILAVRGGTKEKGVDLPVRVREGDADLRAPVLEAVHLLDAGQSREPLGAVRPGVEYEAGAVLGQIGEARAVLRGEAHDFAASEAPRQRGEAVLEHGHLVVRRRYLAAVSVCGGAQGTGVGGRMVDAPLPVRGDRDPVAGRQVEAQLRLTVDGLQHAPVERVALGALVEVEVDQLAAVGELRRGSLHGNVPVSRSTVRRLGQAIHRQE
ncbi:hypothetical protein GCM10020254_03500 [Streptomyces goshikiensis]